MPSPFEDVSSASIPREMLPVLADLRARVGVCVALDGDHAWVRWEPDDEAVVGRLLPVAGVVFYERRGQHWHRWGEALPYFDFPTRLNYQSLAQVLFPLSTQATPPDEGPIRRAQVRLIRSETPQPAAALCAALDDLLAWAEMAPTASLERLRAVRRENRVLILSTAGRTEFIPFDQTERNEFRSTIGASHLPPILNADRFWGHSVLCPLGWRPEPNLPEHVLCETLAIEPNEIVLWQLERLETIPTVQLQPLSRASLRLARKVVAS